MAKFGTLGLVGQGGCLILLYHSILLLSTIRGSSGYTVSGSNCSEASKTRVCRMSSSAAAADDHTQVDGVEPPVVTLPPEAPAVQTQAGPIEEPDLAVHEAPRETSPTGLEGTPISRGFGDKKAASTRALSVARATAAAEIPPLNLLRSPCIARKTLTGGKETTHLRELSRAFSSSRD